MWVSMIRLGKRCRYQDSKYLGQKKFGPRKMWFTKIKPPKNWVKKFLVKIRAVIAEIWLQWINVTSHICCCLDKYHRLKIVPGTYLLSLVKIGSVTAEILLIWTIVSRTYMLPGQMSPWQLASAKDCPKSLPIKFGQNQVSNSWDTPDMDKCRQDKYCLDKCHPDIWSLL